MENNNTEQQEQEPKQGKKWIGYLKKLGFAGFMFFLIKGLVWIAIFVFGAKGCSSLME
ncbi:MAG: hypothetical protein J0G96_04940 [Flavobacteriia bacterium]|nr:hypothetical protein [Flavobacteriia bacterium]